MTARARTGLLIRTTGLDDRVVAFADELSAASGCPVAFVADERHGPIPSRDRQVVGLSEAGCKELGLYCPADFVWKCGDYGYYFARQRFPQTKWFWMIEFDVRFSGPDLKGFFDFFESQSSVDFLAPLLAPAEPDWFWASTVRSRDARPYRCLFPITRLSSRGIDAALEKRIQHSRNPLRRLLWPNDEALVATTLANAGFDCRDFNSFGSTLYSPETFTFTAPIDGDAFRPPAGRTQMFHPVLFGDAYAKKIAKLGQPDPPPLLSQRLVKRIARKLNSLSRW